jgi:serine phosphatase RsbU (regulator of sigma subunit)
MLTLRPTIERPQAEQYAEDTELDIPLTVLVVDDDPSINLLLQTRLRLRGLNVLSASDGREALDLLSETEIDLLLLDVSMPVIGGLEVLSNIRQRGLDTAVIMTTAFGSEQVAIEALRAGADDYLRKPFDAVELRAVLDRTIVRLLLHRQNALLRMRVDDQQRALEAEFARAGEVQRALLPAVAPLVPGYDVAGRCVPSRNVGGDFYDWRSNLNGLTVVLGDVMGKGMPAALVMATVRAALRAVSDVHDPETSIHLVDRALYDDLQNSNQFITLLLIHIDLQSHQGKFVDAGHGHAWILRADGEVTVLEPRGVPLGIFPETKWPIGQFALEPGDALIAYSDGLADADPNRTIDAEEIARHIRSCRTAQETVDRMTGLVPRLESMTDDLTLIALRRRG